MDIRNFKSGAANLRGISFDQVKDFFLTRSFIFLNLLWIGLTIMAAVYIYQGHQRAAQSNTVQMTELKEKQKVVSEYKTIKKEYDDFIKNFPESIPSDQLISKLSSFTVKNGVQILSFSPTEKKSTEYTESASVNLNIGAANYQNIIQFIKDIETSKYVVRIENWSGKISEKNLQHKSQMPAQTAPPGENLIEANIQIISIKLKND